MEPTAATTAAAAAAAAAAATPPAAAATPPAPPAPPSAVPAAAAAPDNVVVLEAAQSNTAAREIADLCTIAGRPELCATFIAEGLSVGDARKKLVNMRADASSTAAAELNNHQPAKNGLLTLSGLGAPATAEAVSSWDKAFAAVHAGDARFGKTA